ncbi:MAG: hypothetical protein H6970_10870 [Gammaproteobacteria bacterium]|nr:hypothetical protein [Gammaproteobacteria bacterium]MCP5459327.1 hypothetical protein [Gammaproteobacteria bacterium]
MTDNPCSRRGFMQICGAAALLASEAARVSAQQQPLATFERVLLTNPQGAPLTCGDLPVGREFVFFYPYASTPCFILKLAQSTPSSVDLQTEDGHAYQWSGGVGPERTIVAFSAICAHRMSYPAAQVSFIGYRPDTIGYLGKDNKIERTTGVIQCCSEQSLYDPAQGARVLSGPAPQPLAAIALQTEDDRLYATGVYGGALFDRFFDRFGFRLALDFGEEHARERVLGQAVAQPLDSYTRQRIKC